jgi:rubrerythrin
MIFTVDKTKYVTATWESNDWYECPNCNYDSIDIGFKHCPICGEGLYFEEDGDE